MLPTMLISSSNAEWGQTMFTILKAAPGTETEQLSAEILKSLKGDVQQRTGEVIEAAVITVRQPLSCTSAMPHARRRRSRGSK